MEIILKYLGGKLEIARLRNSAEATRSLVAGTAKVTAVERGQRANMFPKAEPHRQLLYVCQRDVAWPSRIWGAAIYYHLGGRSPALNSHAADQHRACKGIKLATNNGPWSSPSERHLGKQTFSNTKYIQRHTCVLFVFLENDCLNRLSIANCSDSLHFTLILNCVCKNQSGFNFIQETIMTKFPAPRANINWQAQCWS